MACAVGLTLNIRNAYEKTLSFVVYARKIETTSITMRICGQIIRINFFNPLKTTLGMIATKFIVCAL